MTAPQVTPADVEATIASEHYFRAADGIYGTNAKLQIQLHGEDSTLRGVGIPHGQLAKVLPAGGPLVATWWTCSICGHSKPGGPPSVCAVEANLLPPHLTVDGCPLNRPPL